MWILKDTFLLYDQMMVCTYRKHYFFYVGEIRFLISFSNSKIYVWKLCPVLSNSSHLHFNSTKWWVHIRLTSNEIGVALYKYMYHNVVNFGQFKWKGLVIIMLSVCVFAEPPDIFDILHIPTPCIFKILPAWTF